MVMKETPLMNADDAAKAKIEAVAGLPAGIRPMTTTSTAATSETKHRLVVLYEKARHIFYCLTEELVADPEERATWEHYNEFSRMAAKAGMEAQDKVQMANRLVDPETPERYAKLRQLADRLVDERERRKAFDEVLSGLGYDIKPSWTGHEDKFKKHFNLPEARQELQRLRDTVTPLGRMTEMLQIAAHRYEREGGKARRVSQRLYSDYSQRRNAAYKAAEHAMWARLDARSARQEWEALEARLEARRTSMLEDIKKAILATLHDDVTREMATAESAHKELRAEYVALMGEDAL